MWWLDVEQKTLELALNYEFLFYADLSECCPSLYTRSIAWAILGKEIIEKGNNRNDFDLIGNKIARYLQYMNQNKTSGVPQGSVLIDLIAEIVLGYLDVILADTLNKHKIVDYRILRYRDDYRILVNNPITGEKIIRLLSEVLVPFGLKINAKKNLDSKDVISNALKADKYAWILKKQNDDDLQKQLLIIYDHGLKFPNAGSLIKTLNKIDEALYNTKEIDKMKIRHPKILISILSEIAYKNPRTFNICLSIISKLLSLLKKDERKEIIKKIYEKINKLHHMMLEEIWLQRVALPLKVKLPYHEMLCNLVEDPKNFDKDIWHSEWIKEDTLRNLIDPKKIINFNKLQEMPVIIKPKEINKFLTYP